MALNIENTSGAPLAINDLGIELAIGQIVDLSLIGDPFGVANSANGGDLDSLITAPSVSVKDPIDGTTALSVADGLAACRAMNETHWRVGTGARVGDISDVSITAAANGQVLRFNSSSGDWENTTIASLGGGLLGLGEFEYDSTVGGTPDDKTFRFNNASPASATEIRIDYNNDAGDDLTNFLQALGPGGFIYAQEDEDSTHGFVLVVDDAGTDNGTFITFPIRDIQTLGTAISDGEKYVLVIGGVGGASWNAIATDSGTVTPSTDDDTLNILGGTGIDTSGVDATDTVTITLNASIDDLSDVDTTTTAPTTNDVLSWTGTEWEPMGLTALLNEQLPSVQARRTTTFAVPVSFAAMDFDTTDIENNSAQIEHLNPGTPSDIEVKADGLYYIAAILYTTGGVNTYDARIRVNGSTTLPGGSHGGNVPVTFWAIGDLSAGDNLTIELEQNGGAVTIEAGATFIVYALNGVKGDKGDPGAGSTIIIEDEGIVVGGGPHDTLNFVGSGVTATDAGGGEATITITGGGDVTAAANIVDNSIVRGDGGVKGIQDSEDGTTSWTIADNGQMVGIGDNSGDFIMTIRNLNATTGSGFSVQAGEALGDIAFTIQDSDGSFIIMECEADQGYTTFGDSYANTLSNNGIVYGIDNQLGTSPGSADINSQNGVYRVAGTPVTVGEQVIQEYIFDARRMENPINADWAVNALAPASPDSNNAGMIVRRFDDTTDEGVGFSVRIPPEATDMTIKFVSRAETAPGGAVTAALDLYRRSFPDAGAVTAWSGALALTAIDLPTNEEWQYDEQTITLATLGLTAGNEVQFELVRNGGTLSGDWTLYKIILTFSEES